MSVDYQIIHDHSSHTNIIKIRSPSTFQLQNVYDTRMCVYDTTVVHLNSWIWCELLTSLSWCIGMCTVNLTHFTSQWFSAKVDQNKHVYIFICVCISKYYIFSYTCIFVYIAFNLLYDFVDRISDECITRVFT